MNLLGLLAGNVAGTAAEGLANQFINKLMPSNAPKFLNALQNTQRLGINDLNLSQEEQLSLNQAREFAMNKGIESLEIEIDGQRYSMRTSDFSFVPLV